MGFWKVSQRTAPVILVLGLITSSLAQPRALLPQIALEAPISSWDEGLPIGNGLLGCLLWGEGRTLRFSLDRGDLWDLTPAPELSESGWTYQNLKKLVAEGNQREISRLFDACYEQHATPTKLPVARFEVTLPPKTEPTQFRLDPNDAWAGAFWNSGSVTAFAASDQPIIWIKVPLGDISTQLRQPAAESGQLAKIGYPAARRSKSDESQSANVIESLSQSGPDGRTFHVVVGKRMRAASWEFAITISPQTNSDRSFRDSVRTVQRALDRGYDSSFASHTKYWRNFWKVSQITIPDEDLFHHYVFVSYLLGSGSRPKAPPMPLQGVWTADNGGLPPWKGDYHHDLNTQTTYASYQAAGHFEEGKVFLDHEWKNLPRYQKFAEKFYGVKGAVVPGVATLDGSPLGGWGMYALSSTNSAWIAQLFYRHWSYTADKRFLRDRAYPWCREVGIAMSELLVPSLGNRWVLPLSSSPEIHDNSLKAWLKPNSNYDQALLLSLFESLQKMAMELGKKEDVAQWSLWLSRVRGEHNRLLQSLAISSSGTYLAVSSEESLKASHRHHSHLMSLHPLGLWDPDIEAERTLAANSIDETLKLGTKQWVGYSFSWMACHLARLGRGDQAFEMVKTFVDAFTLRNGFHANGDQSDKGHSDFRYRPFTLEGNFLAMEAVHEMLLQSWSGEIRLFPAVPKSWPRASFSRLRAEGGLIISSRYSEGAVVSLEVESAKDQVVPFVLPTGKRIEVELKKGRLKKVELF